MTFTWKLCWYVADFFLYKTRTFNWWGIQNIWCQHLWAEFGQWKKYQKFLALVPAATEWVCWSSEISGSKLREGLESKSAYSSFAHSLWALLIVKSMFHLLHTCLWEACKEVKKNPLKVWSFTQKNYVFSSLHPSLWEEWTVSTGHTMCVQNPSITIDQWHYFLADLTQCTE